MGQDRTNYGSVALHLGTRLVSSDRTVPGGPPTIKHHSPVKYFSALAASSARPDTQPGGGTFQEVSKAHLTIEEKPWKAHRIRFPGTSASRLAPCCLLLWHGRSYRPLVSFS